MVTVVSKTENTSNWLDNVLETVFRNHTYVIQFAMVHPKNLKDTTSVEDGGIIIVNDVSSLELELTSLILNKDIRDKIGSSAAQHVLSNRGSADLHMECIRRLLLECVEV